MPSDTADGLQIDRLEQGGDSAWDSFVTANSQATFFHLSGWKTVIEESFGHRCHYLRAKRGKDIVGILPLTHVRGRFFGNSLISNGFCVYGGPVAMAPDVLAALDDAALELARELQCGAGRIPAAPAAASGLALQSADLRDLSQGDRADG